MAPGSLRGNFPHRYTCGTHVAIPQGEIEVGPALAEFLRKWAGMNFKVKLGSEWESEIQTFPDFE